MSEFTRSFWTNRTACGVLDEMRQVVKTSSAGVSTKALLNCLIEELQVMYNKMEAGLSDQRDLRDIAEARSKAKKKLHELELKVKFLSGEKDEK